MKIEKKIINLKFILYFNIVVLIFVNLFATASPPPSPPSPSSQVTTPLVPNSVTPAAEISPSSPTQTQNTESQVPPLISIENFNLKLNEVFFPPEKNGVKILTPQISYSVDQSLDENIILSDIIFNQSTFYALSGKAKEFTKANSIALNEDDNILFLTAPKALSSLTDIEILAENGSIIYSESIKKDNIENGALFAKSINPKHWNKVNIKSQTHLLFSTNKFSDLILNDTKKSGYRFCWSKKEDTFFSRYCTPYYRYSKKEKKIVIQTQAANTKAIVDLTELAPEGKIDVEVNQAKRILLTSEQGFSIEFKSKLVPLNLSHFFQDTSGQWVYFIGHTHPPVASETKIFPHTDPESLKAFFKWESTIGNLIDYWVTAIPKDRPFLSLNGIGGGIFRFPLKIDKIPSINTKISIIEPLKSTYISSPTIKGTVNKDNEISSQPPSKLKVGKNSRSFAWQLSAPEKGSDNISYLITKDKSTDTDSKFFAEYSIFRGYSGEFSMRLAGALSTDYKINYLGEIAYNQWFESLLGWENTLFSKQRWGFSAKHFEPLNSKKTSFSLKLTTIDIKYRFTPGLWERDESWGLIFGGENVYINELHGAFAGAGFFWARSMPKLFDEIFNWVPLMRFPKWVDMEMIYYFSPLTSEIISGGGPTYTINFHGKLLWTKFFFGEAGFGLKAYSYINPKTEESVSVQAFYGTAGLGINF